MSRRIKAAATPLPGEEDRPAVPACEVVVIRAGHSHGGITYSVDTRYEAQPDEAVRLRRYDALVE